MEHDKVAAMSEPVAATEIPLDEFHAAWSAAVDAGAPLTVLDVRELDEWTSTHLPDVVLVPLSELADRVGDVPSGRPLYVICAAGKRSMTAATALVDQAGIEAISVAGGTNGWAAAGYPVEAG